MQPNAIPSPYSLFRFCPGNINQTYLRKEGLGTYGNDLVDTTFKNYLNSSSSCSLDTQRWPREEAMGGNRCLEIRGQSQGVPQRNPQTAGIQHKTNDNMLPTNHAMQSFLYKDPILCQSLF